MICATFTFSLDEIKVARSEQNAALKVVLFKKYHTICYSSTFENWEK